MKHLKKFNEEYGYETIWENIDKVYNDYCKDCLNSDGDFSMEFKDWLKNNNYDIIKK